MEFNILNNNVKITPDFINEVVNGTNEISVRPLKTLESISLNSKNISLNLITVRSKNRNILKKYEIFTNEEKIKIYFSSPIENEFKIFLNFTSKITNSFEGFYKSDFNQKDNKRYSLVTHFFEKNARSAFPCFDEPKFKSTFDIELVIDKHLDAIFNTDIQQVEEFNSTKKTVKFNTTPKMSSYLLFLGVGKFEIIEKEIFDIKLRVVSEKPKAGKYGKFALDFGVLAFEYCQNYFRFPYPINKLDLIATKEFLFGAMENWGAIVFKENRLLRYPKLTTLSKELQTKGTIAHEIAHQWFGDLVTPSDFKYLWLNESFATYFGYKTLDNYYPTKEIWERFILSATQDALNRDAFVNTVPIELPEEKGISLNLISSPIIYKKGGCILRQLDYYLGNQTFKEGLRVFISKFAFNVATSDDFWESLEESSNQPIMDLMKSWVTQKGHPVIEIKKEGNRILITQELFTYLGKKSGQKWIIPLRMKTAYKNNVTTLRKTIIEHFHNELDLEEEVDFLLGNDNATGFYHVKYSKELLDRIIENLENFSPIDKWVLENDYFNFLIAGNISFKTYSSIIMKLRDETSLLVIKSIARHLRYLNTHLIGSISNEVRVLGLNFFETIFRNISIEPQKGESEIFTEIRSEILTIASIFGIQEVIEKGLEFYEKLKNNTDLEANLIESSLIIGAMQKNELNWLLSKYCEVEDEESCLNYLKAVCSIQDQKFVSQVLDFALTNLHVRHLQTFIGSVTQNKIFNKDTFNWYIQNVDYFEQQPILTQQYCLYNVITESLHDESELQGFLFHYQEKNPHFSSIVENIIETMAIYDNLKKIKE